MGPASGALSILIAAGFANIGDRLARGILRREPDPHERALGYILAVAGAGAAAHGLALAGLSDPAILRPIAWALELAGLLHLPALARRAARSWTAVRSAWPDLGRFDRLALALCGILLVAFGIGALGPPTDADSLALHLALPMEWLRSHGASPHPDWHHARLTGLGEAIIMIGLAGGTDTLGAWLQFTGLVAAARAVSAFAANRHDAIVGALLILACPVVLFAGLTQKFQLLPAAATTLALFVIVKRFDDLDDGHLTLAFGAVAFAIGCKYSFLFSGVVILALGLWGASRSGRLWRALVIAAAALVIVAAPVHARNWAFYGDPLSPFLEAWRAHPDPVIVEFATIQQEPHQLGSRLARVIMLPAALLMPLRPGGLSEPLGIGVLCVFAVALTRGVARRLVAAAGAAAALALLFGQLVPRFFLEPYMWCAAAAIASGSRRRILVDRLLLAQGAAVAAAALFMAASLAPGLFGERLRDRVMSRMATGYDEARWIGATVPRDAVVLASTRSHALLPRRFVTEDLFTEGAIRTDADVRAFVAAHGVTVVAFELDLSAPLAEFVERCGRRLGERTFTPAARNPWNRGGEHTVVAAEIDTTRADCRP